MGFGDVPEIKEGLFNQAGFQQIRLDSLLSLADRLAINPTSFNENFSNYNYEVIFRSLKQVFLNVFSKLTGDELKILNKLKKEIDALLEYKNPYDSIKRKEGVNLTLNKINWKILDEKLFEFRGELEKAMDNHGLGNPNKEVDEEGW